MDLKDLSSPFGVGEGLAGEMATEGVCGWFSRSAAEGVRCVVSTREGVGVAGGAGSGFGGDISASTAGTTVTFSPGVRGVVRDPDTTRSRDSTPCLELGRVEDVSALEALPWLDPGACTWGWGSPGYSTWMVCRKPPAAFFLPVSVGDFAEPLGGYEESISWILGVTDGPSSGNEIVTGMLIVGANGSSSAGPVDVAGVTARETALRE